MLTGNNIHYDVDGRYNGISCGGIGVIHQMVQKMGLPEEINSKLELLKRHLPYHESDHILNIVYNILAGGTCLEDIELRRNDAAYLHALGSEIMPDPTTAGDYLRRFKLDDIILLMDIINEIRRHVWLRQSLIFREQAIMNIDGTIGPTTGECKQGMDISYNGYWSYHPLVLSLASTREPLFIVNRPGNVPSHSDSATWIDKGLDLLSGVFKKVLVRGDTDFSLTVNFDLWLIFYSCAGFFFERCPKYGLFVLKIAKNSKNVVPRYKKNSLDNSNTMM
ncbi:MAG: transposase [Desulfatirhabdiaceae bacterium]